MESDDCADGVPECFEGSAVVVGEDLPVLDVGDSSFDDPAYFVNGGVRRLLGLGEVPGGGLPGGGVDSGADIAFVADPLRKVKSFEQLGFGEGVHVVA